VPRRPDELTDTDLAFLVERHLGTLTTLRADGSPHVVAISFGYDPDDRVARIITSDRTQKVRNIERDGRAAICQVEGRLWLTLEGKATVSRDPERVARAVAAFEDRYRPTSENPNRVAIEVVVERVLGRA
jgi:PPOX class probable F420-dependent enzyme